MSKIFIQGLERSLKNDLEFGLVEEVKILDLIQDEWNDEEDIRNTKDIYDDDFYPYDFESKNGTSWELKSRRITKQKYSTTIIPVHKVRKTDKKQIFIFNFTDCCSYIEYDKALFDTFKTRYIKVERFGGNPSPVLHYEIPVKSLVDIIAIHRIK